MSIYLGDTEIKDIYVGTSKVKEVYVGDCKVYPIIKLGYLDVVVVGGGGSAGSLSPGCYSLAGGGGGGGVIYCCGYELNIKDDSCIPITVGCGGAFGGNNKSCNGGDSIFKSLIAKGGGVGGGWYNNYNSYQSPGNGGSGGGGANGGDKGLGTNGQGCNGGSQTGRASGGGGGAGSVGTTNQYAINPGGAGLNVTIGGVTNCFSPGGSGAYSGCSSTSCPRLYGAGGNSSRCNNSNISSGKQGIVIIGYKTDGSCGIKCATGGTKYTCGNYTIHCFTSNGTFCIES